MQSKAPHSDTYRQAQGARPRRGPLVWIKRGLVGLVIGLFALAFIGATYQAIATQIAQRTYPPPGKMVDVNGRLMHINCIGEGSPTVVLEAASPGMSAGWVRVQQQLAKTTRVCAYDRGGMAWSESGPKPRDAEQISNELRTLLDNAGIKGPYVLAGHSYGGLYARVYADRHPEEVAGVVLVDSSHPEQFTRSAQGREAYEQIRRLGTIAPLLSRLGVVRLFDLVPAPPDLPTHQQEQIEAFNSSTRQVLPPPKNSAPPPKTWLRREARGARVTSRLR